MKSVQKTFWVACLAICSLLVSQFTATASTVLGPPSQFAAQMYSLGACENAKEVDCIESVGIIQGDGKYVAGTWLDDQLDRVSQDSLGNAERWGRSRWSVATSGGTKIVQLSANFEAEGHRKPMDNKAGYREYGALRTMVYVDDPLNTKVRFSLRTSWLAPLNVPMFANEALFKQIKLPTGNRWIFEGKGMTVSSYSSDAVQKLKDDAWADFENTAFYFVIDHAGFSDSSSAWSTLCSDLGYTATASNSTLAAMPAWNSAKKSLEFNVYAPHKNTSGVQNLGFFRLWIDEDFMNCRWPENDLSSAANVEIRVINADGTEQVAVTQVARNKGRLYLSASGFHYSSPTLLISKAAGTLNSADIPGDSLGSSDTVSALPSPSPTLKAPVQPVAKKKTTITCVSNKNKKLTKLVTAVAPKCPAGYKKR